MATKIQLMGTGPFETPAIVDYLGLGYPLSGTMVQIRFALEDGNELHLPIQGIALEKLTEQLAASRAKNKKKGFATMSDRAARSSWV